MKLVVFAEAFGFGPASAARQIADVLATDGFTVTFAGSRHTLDLAAGAGLHVVDVDTTRFEEIAATTDGVISCMDLDVARRSVAAGVPTVLYDALSWFWRRRPAAVDAGAGWVCQDFLGVAEAVREARAAGLDAVVVPPLAHPVPAGSSHASPERSGPPVVCLGGIANPAWDDATVQRYADWVVDAVRTACQETGHAEPLVLGSARVAEALRSRGVDARCVAPAEAQLRAAAAPVVFATPGLGNLYEAAACANPTVWLPGANDSQARQVDMLCAAGMLDAAVRWADLGVSLSFDAGDQRALLEALAGHVESRPELEGHLVRAVDVALGDDRALRRMVEAFPPSGPEPAARAAARMLADRFTQPQRR